MKTEKIFIGDDCITRRTNEEWAADLNPIYEMALPPRCKMYPTFAHEVPIRYYALTGNVLFLVEGEETRIKQGQFIFIPATIEYCFRGLDHTSCALLAQPKSEQAEKSWREVAELIHKQK